MPGRTTMSAEGQNLVGAVCFDLLLEEALRPEVTHVGGLTMGADPISYAIAHESWSRGDPLDAFSVRKTEKAHGTGQRIEGGLPENARAIIIEDTLTTGRSALEAIRAVTQHGASVICVLSLVDREEGGRERLESHGHRLVGCLHRERTFQSSLAVTRREGASEEVRPSSFQSRRRRGITKQR